MLCKQDLARAGTARENLGRCTKVILRPASVAFERLSTAVTSVVSACSVVVLGIAVRVAFQLQLAHLPRLQFELVLRIQTLALCAIFEVVLAGGATAVSAIPIATAVVVFIVASFVPLPFRSVAGFGAGLFSPNINEH